MLVFGHGALTVSGEKATAITIWLEAHDFYPSFRRSVLIMDFSYFAVRVCGEIGVCSCDFLKITDGDGTILLDKSCGFSSDSDPESATDLFIPPNIMSETNIVRIFFQTDETLTHNGWSVTWEAVQRGLLLLFKIRFIKSEHIFST